MSPISVSLRAPHRPLRALVLVTATLAATGLGSCASDSRFEFAEGTPEDVGMDSAVLEGARTYAFTEGRNTQGVVVVRPLNDMPKSTHIATGNTAGIAIADDTTNYHARIPRPRLRALMPWRR